MGDAPAAEEPFVKEHQMHAGDKPAKESQYEPKKNPFKSFSIAYDLKYCFP